MLSALFAPDGYEVETVQSGEQALKMASEREYHSIIADRRMGAGATDRFTQALLNSCPHVRDRLVVACSRDEALSRCVGPAGGPHRDQAVQPERSEVGSRGNPSIASGTGRLPRQNADAPPDLCRRSRCIRRGPIIPAGSEIRRIDEPSPDPKKDVSRDFTGVPGTVQHQPVPNSVEEITAQLSA